MQVELSCVLCFCCFFFAFSLNWVGQQQRFAKFRDNKPPSIFEVQEWFEKPFTCYLVAPIHFELHFQIGPGCYVSSAILRLHKRQEASTTIFDAASSC